MKKLFDAADRYVESSNWKTMTVLKFCLISLGIMIGMMIGKEHRKPVIVGAASVFIATYIPLMKKFYDVYTERQMVLG